MFSCLSQGYPFIFGAQIYSSFEDLSVMSSGQVPMPRTGWFFRDRLLGGHAMLACGYSMKTKKFLVRNSWGKDKGVDGYFFMPFSYLLSSAYVSDCWTIRKVEEV
jgi:C1A family cysteine protease